MGRDDEQEGENTRWQLLLYIYPYEGTGVVMEVKWLSVKGSGYALGKSAFLSDFLKTSGPQH